MALLFMPFRGSPGISLFLVVGMAATIGLVVAALGLGDMLSVPLSVSNPDGLAAFYEASPRGRQARLSYPLFVEIRDDCRSCGRVAATHLGEVTFELNSTIDSISAELVSPEYFAALGVNAKQGRLFGETGSFEADAETMVVVGEGFSRKHFKSGNTVGSKIVLNGRPFVIVGVVAGDFTGLGFETDVWLPLESAAILLSESNRRHAKGARWLVVFTRLRDSSDSLRVLAEMESVSPRYRETDLLGEGAVLRCGPDGFPWTRRLGDIALVTWVFGGGGFVTLLALCLNAALVVLAHSAARRGEVAVKLALGASRRMIVLERAWETAILATIGGVLSFLVAQLILSALPRAVPGLPANLAKLDVRGLLIALALAWLIALVSVLPVVFSARRVSLTTVLAGSQGALTMSVPAYRFQKWLVGAQVSLCIMLIAGGVLLFRSVENMQQVRVGSRPERILLTRIAPAPLLQQRETGESAYLRMIEVLESLAAVDSASLSSHVPIGGGAMGATVALSNASVADHSRFPPVDILLVGPRFFRTFGLQLLAGRDFEATDRVGRSPIAAVNEVLAKRLCGQDSALGQVISVMGGHATIVAVVENAKRQSLSEAEVPQLYLPFLQHFESRMVLIARTRAEAEAVAPLIRKEIEEATNIRVLETFSLRAHLDHWLREARTVTTTFLLFGSFILALSLGGVYSVASLFVVGRRREIGLRLALGSTRGGIAARVAREISMLTTASMIVGLTVTFGAARIVSHVLYGVGPLDPVTIAVSLVLTFTSTSLTLLRPVVEALRVHPAELLRST